MPTSMLSNLYAAWLDWKFTLAGYYDRPVAPANRAISSWDGLLTAWQIRRGVVEVHHARGRLTAGPGDWVLIPPGVSRRHRFSDDAAIRSIRCAILDPAGLPPLSRHGPRTEPHRPDLTAAADDLAGALPEPSLFDRHAHPSLPLPTATWAQLQASVLVWCATAVDGLDLAPMPAPEDRRIDLAQRLLMASPSPSAVPWGELREATGLSRAQLDRLFRRHCGGSLRTWRDRRLLEDACRGLGSREEPVKAVSARLGFRDASHFCRWFRIATGTTPQRWRQRGGV